MQFRSPRDFPLSRPRVQAPLLAAATVLLFSLCSQAQQKKTAPPKASAHKPEAAKPAPTNPEAYWEAKVEPLLDKQCLKCHAGVRQQGGLDLRSLDTILRGGDSGPEIIPGKPAESRILSYIVPNAEEHMPPDPKRQLSPEEIGIFKTWIAMLPAPKSPKASGKSKDNTWAADYLVDYRKGLPKRDVLPENLKGSAAIDWFLQSDWKRDNVQPAALSSDGAFVRRLYLDIAGRIPKLEELRTFVADKRVDKRSKLIDTLIASDDYSRHMREVFDTILMGRQPQEQERRGKGGKGRKSVDRSHPDGSWSSYLETSFRNNRPWNEMVHDMLVARTTDGPAQGAEWFLESRNNSYQAMAEAVAPVVFGVQIGCAQCHNHPLAWEIEQRHYWGLVAVFNRSKNVDTDKGPGVAESAVGGFISFANLKKETQPATLVFLNGKSVAEKIPGANDKEVDSPDLYVVPPATGKTVSAPSVPKFSRREAFADSVTHDNPQLGRAFANRLWADLMGRGIVPAVDQIDSRHHASHPELLEWLGHDFEQSGYDIKRLVRNIVSTRAYQLDQKSPAKTAPLPDTFARALDKPLSAEQLLRSLWVATGSTPEAKEADRLERLFAAKFPDLMVENYNPSLQQALFLTNGTSLDDLLQPGPGNTTSKLMVLKTNEERVRDAFSTVLGRAPDAPELKQCLAMMATQTPEKGTRNLLWALLTCAEFQVNH